MSAPAVSFRDWTLLQVLLSIRRRSDERGIEVVEDEARRWEAVWEQIRETSPRGDRGPSTWSW